MRILGGARWALVAAAVTSVFVATEAGSVDIPGRIDPGRIEQHFKRGPSVKSGADIKVQRQRKKAILDKLKTIKLTLSGIKVTGNKAMSAAQLRPIYVAMLNKQISAYDLFVVAQKITTKYRKAGFIISQAVVPRQRIQGGIVRIHVVEGFIDRVIVQRGPGLRGRSIHTLNEYGRRIVAARPLHRSVLERYLLLANDLAGLTVRSVVKPSKKTPGAATLVFVVKDNPVDMWGNVNNHGSRFMGPYQGELGVAGNSLIQLGDRTSSRVINTFAQPGEMLFWEVRHRTPIGYEGTTLEVAVNNTVTHPGYTLKLLNITGRAWFGGLTVRHPFLRSRRRNLHVYGVLDMRRSTNRFSGAILSEDRVRSLRIGATYDMVDAWRGVTLIDISFSKGLDFLGARGDSRLYGRTNYSKFNLLVQRDQHLYKRFSLFAAFSGQYALTNLLSSEDFGLGGRRFGRGFDPSEAVGDHGIAVITELRYSHNKVESVPWQMQYQLYLFGDWGRVEQRNHVPGIRGFRILSSIGGGVRFNVFQHISGHFEVAKPIIGSNRGLGSAGHDWRAFFTLGIRTDAWWRK